MLEKIDDLINYLKAFRDYVAVKGCIEDGVNAIKEFDIAVTNMQQGK